MPGKINSQINQSMLQRIADSVPAIVALYDISTAEYIYVNKALFSILGYLPEDFITGGLNFAVSIVHPDDVQPLLEKNQQALEAANHLRHDADEPIAKFEYRMKHKNGSWRWIHTDGTIFERSADGKVKLILNVSLDITDRKNAELRLIKSMKILENVLSSDPNIA